MSGCAKRWNGWRWLALGLVLLCRLSVAQVQVEPALPQSEETATLVQRVQDEIARVPPDVGSVDVRVTVGRTAFENAIAASDPRPIVAAFLTSSEFEAALDGRDRSHVTAVFSNPDPRDQAALARALLDGSTLAVFDSTAAHHLVQLLGNSVHLIPASAGQSIDSLLRAADPFDAIVALPDSAVLNRSNINHVVRTLYERRKVLIGYSVTLTRVGGLASVYASPEAVARSVADILRQYAATGRLQAPSFVDDIDVVVNDRLARSLNIAVPERAQLLDAVRSRRSEGAR